MNSYESCTGTSALELHIKDTRDPPTLNAKLNLTTFPWDLALQDLKDFTGLTFSDPQVEYKWLGEGTNWFGFFLSFLIGIVIVI